MSIPGGPEQPADQPRPARLVRATYIDGVLRPSEPLDLPPGASVDLLIPGDAPALGVAARPPGRPAWPSLPAIGLGWPLAAAGPLAAVTRGELLLLLAGLGFYLLTRLVGLVAYPIYFFCDEAIQAVLARDLLASGLRGRDGTFLPPYFLNAEKWNLGLSVYIHALASALFGTSAFVTRATSVLVSALGAAAVALTLRLAFQARLWWLAPLLLAATPAWFLHSRTAFETVMAAAFYACFLCCYLLYRQRGPAWLYPTLVFGAMTFYSYSNGQGLMLVSGGLLLLLDLPYHLRQARHHQFAAAVLLVLLALPLARFRLLQPDAYADQLRDLDSYWMRPLPLPEKLARFAQQYLVGLSPLYWFLPNTIDIERHRMLGMGHLPLWAAPPALVGLGLCLSRLGSPAHRAVLVALLAVPFSPALVAIGITRVLAMVVPATILTVLGLEQILAWAGPRLRPRLAGALLAGLIAIAGAATTRAALVDGPTWFRDYGLAGMQYGARQLFEQAIPAALAADPQASLLVSPTWANNPDTFLEFFLSPADRQRVQLINIDAFTVSRRELDPARHLFVMPEYEYARAVQSGKFTIAAPERVLYYPDGRPGFYFVRMAYVPNIDDILAADRAARAQLVETPLALGGEQAVVAHSLLDIGSPANLFDGDPESLARGFEANPLVIELRFASPRSLSGLDLTVGSMDFELTATATVAGGPPVVLRQSYSGLPPDPTVGLELPAPAAVSALRLEIRQTNAGEVAHIHVREIALR